MILLHGIDHSQSTGHLDNILAVVHSDNAIELLLKDRARISSNIERTQIPTLLDGLQHDSIVSSLSGDIRLVHAMRNASYHIGIAVDVYAIDFVISTAKKLFSQCGLYPDGGEHQDLTSEAKGIMVEALEIFIEAKLDRQKAGLYKKVVLLCANALQKILRLRFEETAVEKYGGKWNERFPGYSSWNVKEFTQNTWELRAFVDPVLLLDLEHLNAIGNILVEAPPEISEEETREILQKTLHFAYSTQPYLDMAKEMVPEDALFQILQDYNIPFERDVEFRLGKQVFSSFDFVIPSSKDPIAIIETKLERIRSDYFKAMLFDVDLLKRKYPYAKFYMIYSREKTEENQLTKMRELSSGRIDGLFDFSETAFLLEGIRKDLHRNMP